MGGVGKQMKQTEALGQSAAGTSDALRSWSGESRAMAQGLNQPAAAFNWSMAQGGDAARGAAGPLLQTIGDSVAKMAENASMNPRGGAAGTSFAAMLPQKRTQMEAAAIQGPHQASYGELASYGLGEGASALQEIGASLRGTQGALSSNKAAMDAKAKQKEAMTSFLGQLAQAGGGVASKALTGGGGKTKTNYSGLTPSPVPSWWGGAGDMEISK